MVTFYRIKDIDKFFRMIDCCTGRVLLKSSDEKMVDLRKSTLIRELLVSSCNAQGIEKLDLIIEDHQDMPRIQCYLMECYSKTSLKQLPRPI